MHFGHTFGSGPPCSLGSHSWLHRSQRHPHMVSFTFAIPVSIYPPVYTVKEYPRRYCLLPTFTTSGYITCRYTTEGRSCRRRGKSGHSRLRRRRNCVPARAVGRSRRSPAVGPTRSIPSPVSAPAPTRNPWDRLQAHPRSRVHDPPGEGQGRGVPGDRGEGQGHLHPAVERLQRRAVRGEGPLRRPSSLTCAPVSNSRLPPSLAVGPGCRCRT